MTFLQLKKNTSDKLKTCISFVIKEKVEKIIEQGKNKKNIIKT